MTIVAIVDLAPCRATKASERRIFEVDPVLCEGCGGEIERILKHLGQPAHFPTTKPPRAPPLLFGSEAREESQLDPRSEDERQDWPPGPDLPA